MKILVGIGRHYQNIKMKIILGIFAVILVTALSFVIFFHFKYRVKNIIFENTMNYSDEELYSYVTEGRLRKYVPLLIYLNESGNDVNIPLIKNYEVFKIDNHTVRVKLHPRTAFISVSNMGEYLVLDEEGYVITTSKGRLVGIPVIDGLSYNSFDIGKIIPGDERTIKKIYEIVGLSYEYAIDLLDVIIETNGHITLKCGNITVYCSRTNDFASVFEVVGKASEKTKNGNWYIDFTGRIDSNSTIQVHPVTD